MKNKVIGEGSYGCVIKPSLKCKDNDKIDYKNKISKVMTNYHTNEELKEYSKVSKIDKDKKYYLGIPETCRLDITIKSNMDAIRKCKINSQEFIRKKNDLSLLIIEDGGVSIREFADEINLSKNKNFIKKSKENVERFWIEAHVLLEGIDLYLENNLIHHDLKPQNIVYDYNKNRLNFIDFGLMTNKKDIIENSKMSEYDLAIYHWSYPLEMNFYNKDKYLEFCSNDKKMVFDDLMFKLNDTKYNSSLKSAIKQLFNFIFFNKPEYKEEFKVFFEEKYREMIYYGYEDINNYKNFINDSIETMDIYGLGISFFYVLNNTEKYIDKKTKESIKNLCFRMLNPNLSKRIKIKELINEYENIIEESGLLEKYGKKFENHKLIDYNYDIFLEKSILNLNSINMSKKEFKEFMTNEDINCDPREKFDKSIKKCIYNIKKCPQGKELNPFTKRCNNNCKSGFSRNNVFKCRKTKKLTSKTHL